MRQKMSNEAAEQTKPEAHYELTIKEIIEKEAPTWAVPSTAQGGTKNTRRHQQSGRGGWSKEEDGPAPSSSAADILRYNLQESGYPAEEHMHHIGTKTKPTFKCALKDGMNLHTAASFFCYTVKLKQGCICQSHPDCCCGSSTTCVTMVQLVPHPAFSYSRMCGEAMTRTQRSFNVADFSRREQNTQLPSVGHSCATWSLQCMCYISGPKDICWK